ncbi:SURF1 family protein [Alteromonas pelagimontana]|uniref:SURF1-like protein n=1 Tax=Alteromonas pelagimontana TaxID=1858656 RepID=A0A6M4MDE7_9ALTE|nr:SURF1 family protein [Alteromonas pelagimontana]QJR80858.1 SURF1 family protein [Alteromonas pelagimontana]
MMTQTGSTRPLFAISIAAVAVIGMVALGLWQLERMRQKEERLTSIAQKQQNGTVALAALDPVSEDIRDYSVTFQGVPHPEMTMLLDNQIEKSQVGFDVIVPVQTAQGWLLVNWGWVAANKSRMTLPTTQIEANANNFSGIIMVPENNPLVRETAAPNATFPAVIQQLDLNFIGELTGQTLLPFVIQLNAPASASFVRTWAPVVMPPEKHFAYAIQWFALAIAAASVTYFVVFARNKKV